MSATVRIAGVEATIDGYVWTSDDATLAGLLNAMLDPTGPSGSDPAPDLHAAQAAVDVLRGEVVESELPGFVAGRVY